MANVQGMCTSFKNQILRGEHQLGAATLVSRTSLTAPTTDVVNAALFLASASRGVADTVYTTTGEVNAGSVNYAAGGIAVTNANTPAASGTAAVWTPSASLSWPTLTSGGSFDCALLYNVTQSNKAIAVYTFGAQTITANNFSLTMPVNAAGTALLQIT